MNFGLDTKLIPRINGDAIEIQEISVGMINQHWVSVINTRDRMVREALIAMGWTPPTDKPTEPHGST